MDGRNQLCSYCLYYWIPFCCCCSLSEKTVTTKTTLNVIYKRPIRWFLFLRLNYRFGSSDMRRLCKIFCFWTKNENAPSLWPLLVCLFTPFPHPTPLAKKLSWLCGPQFGLKMRWGVRSPGPSPGGERREVPQCYQSRFDNLFGVFIVY